MKKIRANMGNRNPFRKEYISGRKDQFDVDYKLFRKAVDDTERREELIKYLEEMMQYVIAHIEEEREAGLLAEMDLS